MNTEVETRAARSLMAQQLVQVMAGMAAWKSLTPLQKQALTAISGMVSRILSGGADNADHWHDIATYAELAKSAIPNPTVLTARPEPWCECCGVMQPPHMVHCAEGLKEVGKHLGPTTVDLTCKVCGEKAGHFGLPCPQMTPKATL
jgi:hypothetical protein